MAFPLVFTKQLAAASSNNIAASQSLAGAGNLVLNGSATNYLSTTSSAAAAVGTVNIPMTATTGVTIGQRITDTTTVALVVGTLVKALSTTGVVIWPPVGGVGVGSGDTIIFPGTAIIDTSTSTNSATGRRVIITSAGNDSGLTWTITGTNQAGNAITDSFAGANGVAQSNLDFVTVAQISGSAATASTVTAGTNGVGSSPWITLNADATSTMNVGFSVEIVSGACNFTVQHTYDDPNMLLGGATYPEAFNNSIVNGVSAAAEGVYAMPISAIRVLINSGTGEIRMRVLQSSIG